MERSTEPRKRSNGYSVKSPPMKRPRVEVMEKEKALQLRKKHLAYVPSMFTGQVYPTCFRQVVCTIGTVFAQKTRQ